MGKNQELQILKDKNSKGKDRQWRERKLQNLKLGAALEQLGYKIFNSVNQCAEVLKFIQQEDGSLKLKQTWFCKNKLCPICNWRRAMKYSWQTSLMVDEAIKQFPKGRFLFLTLTVENVPGEELNEELSRLALAFNRLMKYKKISKNILGFIRATEVTKNEMMNTYHPHMHVLLFVKSTYFKTEEDYLSQEEWTKFWKKAAKLPYTPIVDIRAVRTKNKSESDPNGMRKAILETAKYPVKPIDFDEENLQTVDDLYSGMYRKRLIAFGGIFKEIRKELFLDDVEEGNLIKVSDDEDKESSTGKELIAVWNWERKNYFVR